MNPEDTWACGNILLLKFKDGNVQRCAVTFSVSNTFSNRMLTQILTNVYIMATSFPGSSPTWPPIIGEDPGNEVDKMEDTKIAHHSNTLKSSDLILAFRTV